MEGEVGERRGGWGQGRMASPGGRGAGKAEWVQADDGECRLKPWAGPSVGGRETRGWAGLPHAQGTRTSPLTAGLTSCFCSQEPERGGG